MMPENGTRKEFLNLMFDYVLSEGSSLMVRIKTPDMPELETIINPPANVAAKIAYYNDAYDDDMCLKSNPDIRMDGVGAYTFNF